jgi:HSP20 family protein
MLAKINRRYAPAYWDDFFNDSFFNGFNHSGLNRTSPAVNVIEEDKAYRIEVAVPGMSRKDFRIDLEDEVLTISSEQKENNEEKNHRYMRREFQYNTFKRSFQLPETIDADSIKASHNAGILTIELPKKDEVVQKAPKQIEIK